MIYIIDNFNDHGKIMYDIIKYHTQQDITRIHLLNEIPTFELYALFTNLFDLVLDNDIIYIPWQKEKDYYLDMLATKLSTKCWVVASAGNANQDIENFSPTSANGVYAVGALNKSLVKASHSNYSSNNMQWIIGTNYTVNDSTHNGTSISAAIYTAFLANAIIENDLRLVEQQIAQYHLKNGINKV